MNKIFKILCILLFSSWVSTLSAQETFYWFGGSGNWTDINHWSLTSGNEGGVLAPRVPNATDNVVFDDKSATGTNYRVFMNAEGFVKDFKVINSPTKAKLELMTTSLNIYGNFQISSTTTASGGFIKFKGIDDSNTIQTNGVNIETNIYFEGLGKKVLLDDFTARGVLGVNGIVKTNDHKFTLTESGVSGVLADSFIDFGASEVRLAGSLNVSTAVVNSTNQIIFTKNARIEKYGPTTVVLNKLLFEKEGQIAVYNSGSFLDISEVEFKDKGVFDGRDDAIKIGVLKLAPAKVYQFKQNSTVTVHTLIANTPDCQGLMEFKSSASNASTVADRATLAVTSEVHINNVRITNIAATGTTFTAVGVDNGNNTGWTFVEPPSKTIYWVGTAGDGEWNNLANWSATSGGAGGYCIPTQFDDVIFDGGSVMTVPVKITGSIATCHNITVDGVLGTPNFSDANSGTIEIHGSSRWQTGMRWAFITLYKGKAIDNTITSNGVAFNRNVQFDCIGGGWIFQDDFTLDKASSSNSIKLLLINGTLNTNSKEVSIVPPTYISNNDKFDIFKGDGDNSHLILGSSKISVPSWSYSGKTLDAGTSHIYVLLSDLKTTTFYGKNGHTYYDVTYEGHGTSMPMGASFNHVHAKGSLEIGKANSTGIGKGTYKILELTGGMNYIFSSNLSNQTTITEQFIYNTLECSGLPFFASIDTGISSIKFPPTNVHVANVKMKNIAASGSGIYTASGLNMGGNSNWQSFDETIVSKSLYWIGGDGDWYDPAHWTTSPNGVPMDSGGCVPTEFDDVFFNEYSASANFTVTNVTQKELFCRDMTWTDGVTVKGSINSRYINLNVYGSLRTSATVSLNAIYLNFYGKASHTLETNGAQLGTSNVNFVDSGTYTLVDDFNINADITVSVASIFHSNGKKITANILTITGTTDISNSELVLKGLWVGPSANLETANSVVKVQGNIYSKNHTYNIVELSNGYLDGANTFDRLTLNGNVEIRANNTIRIMTLLPNQSILTLNKNTKQTISEMLYLSGTPCRNNTIKSKDGQAEINVVSGKNEYDFVVVQGINATGLPLVFDRNSVNNGNNTQITFITGTGGLVGLGADRLCNYIDNNDPDSYTLDAAGFYGGETTTYKWTKIGDSNHTGVLSTTSTLDIATLGYGKYKVEVDYGGVGTNACKVADELIIAMTAKPTYAVTGISETTFCVVDKADVSRLNPILVGQDLKWYTTQSGGTSLDSTVLLTDGMEYYATQTINGCESKERTKVKVVVKQCNVLLNPSLRIRVME